MTAPEQWLWRLMPGLSGMSRAERWRRLILVVEAYIDDSGSGDPPVFLLAGFVARAEQWAEFSERWLEALRGPPKLEYFKMKEAAALEGQFKGWKEEGRDARVVRLIDIIKDHVLVAVSSAVFHRDYSEVISDKLSKETDPPYWLIYHSVMELVYRWELANGIREKVNFIFDEQFKQSDMVQASWSVYYEQSPPHFKELFGDRPVHKNDKCTFPLQAADLLAWHIRRDYYEHNKGNTFSSPTMDSLRSMNGVRDLWTKTRLQEVVFQIHNLNAQLGKVTPHQYRDMIRQMPESVSRINLDVIGKTNSNACGLISPFPAIGTKRFLLVDSCPFSRSPHLHRRRGNACVLQEQASAQLSDSEPRQ
jgi:hypothetical protein